MGATTDVLDCQWLQQLHTFGLLSAAFRLAEDVAVLRSYLRQREMLVQYSAQHIQHMQKALHQMNVKLDKVLSDITGLTGLSIIQAILDGERNPHVLAKFRDFRCRREEAEIAEALRGNWRGNICLRCVRRWSYSERTSSRWRSATTGLRRTWRR